MELSKEILVQYCEMIEEIKDIRRRIQKLEREIDNLSAVSDSVKGTRPDGTYGSIRIEGYPAPEYYRKVAAIEKYKVKLETKEAELLEMTTKAEEYIESIDSPELRIMMRLYYIDGLSYITVAHQMNSRFPKRNVKYTDENVRKRIQRFFEKI